MKVILEPICYLLRDGNGKIIRTIFDDKRYKSLLERAWSNKDDYLRAKIRLRRDVEKYAIKNPVKARAYKLQLSRQLIEYFLEKYSAAVKQKTIEVVLNNKEDE
jgi:hypothetical protein